MGMRTRSRSVRGSHNIHNRNAPYVHVTMAPVAPTAGLKVLEMKVASTKASGAADKPTMTERDGRSMKMPRGTVDLMKGEGKFVG